MPQIRRFSAGCRDAIYRVLGIYAVESLKAFEQMDGQKAALSLPRRKDFSV
jgi:hypothetical protein